MIHMMIVLKENKKRRVRRVRIFFFKKMMVAREGTEKQAREWTENLFLE
jgi:hypothetical protein